VTTTSEDSFHECEDDENEDGAGADRPLLEAAFHAETI
jgi:hypothetical protein